MSKDSEYFLQCGIKSLWHKRSLDDFTNCDEALEIVKKYISSPRKYLGEGIGLYLWGANGTGKSHLLNCAFKELLMQRYRVRIYSIDEVVDAFTASWYSDEARGEMNTILRTKQFIGIDEFGKNIDADGKPVRLPDLVKRIVESIIRYRVQMKLPIWISSNTEPKFLSSVFSEDVASLLNEAVVDVQVTGVDYRKIIYERNKRKLL